MFSKDTKIGTLAKDAVLKRILPLWWPYGKLGLLLLGGKTLGDLCGPQTPYNVKDVANGLVHLYEAAARAPDVCISVYTKEEIEADQSRKNVKILRFPVQGSERMVLICAGGGYNVVASIVEAFPVAQRLNQLGISAYVLNYRTKKPCAAPKADEDLRRAIKLITEHDADQKYGLMGFSAGAHLVAGMLTKNRGAYVSNVKAPAIVSLAYPLLSLQLPEKTAQNKELYACYKAMFGKTCDPQIMEQYNIIKNLDCNTAAVYLWQTQDDELVDFKSNAQAMAKLLAQKGIAHRFKSVKSGKHGLGLGSGSEADGWVEDFVNFWNTLGDRR